MLELRYGWCNQTRMQGSSNLATVLFTGKVTRASDLWVKGCVLVGCSVVHVTRTSQPAYIPWGMAPTLPSHHYETWAQFTWSKHSRPLHNYKNLKNWQVLTLPATSECIKSYNLRKGQIFLYWVTNIAVQICRTVSNHSLGTFGPFCFVLLPFCQLPCVFLILTCFSS